MDFPDVQRLKETIDRLTRENAKLRTQLAVTQQWNPPLDLERAFRSVRGWQCLTVSLIPENPTLILISGTECGKESEDADAADDEEDAGAGEVWRHLQTAAAPRGRIGPFARARMPGRLLGYLREQSGRTIIVLNRDLRRGQVSRAARMLRENAKKHRPAGFLELSAIPLLSLCALFPGNLVVKGTAGLSAAAAPAATIMLPAAVMSTALPHIDLNTVTIRSRPASHVRHVDRRPAWPPAHASLRGRNPSPRR
ncbi:hypothetical protein [Actinomadura formosensis]|uniref:hypothetical protein n=1 Tax=Actinomadura formosensis TaxID=60706 RepID=UPI003D8BFB2A